MSVDTSPESSSSRSTEKHRQQTGLVIAHHGASLLVETADQQQRECHSRKSAGPLVAGDQVVVETGERDNVIIRRLPRRCELARPDNRGKSRIIAANIDQILIVIAPRPAFKEALIDRYLVAAELSGITPVIVLNKVDLLTSEDNEAVKKRLAVYEQIGYEVVEVSAKQANGFEALHQVLGGRNNIFVGQSGVGKSSLINALLPEVDARVGDVSHATNKGTHTTTTARLYHLPQRDGNIIDSPGIREFGLWQVGPADLASGFRELVTFRSHCKFRDCLHRQEPGCAVRAAVEAGQISPQRYRSYLNLLESLEQDNH